MGFFVKIDYLRFLGWIEACLLFGSTNCIIWYSLVPSIDWYKNRRTNWLWSSNKSCFVKTVQNLKNLSAFDMFDLSFSFFLHDIQRFRYSTVQHDIQRFGRPKLFFKSYIPDYLQSSGLRKIRTFYFLITGLVQKIRTSTKTGNTCEFGF